jgi:hypothetical protein
VYSKGVSYRIHADKIVAPRRTNLDVEMEGLDDNFFDCVNFDAMEDVDANIPEQEAPSKFRSIGWVMHCLDANPSIHRLAQEIMT